MLGNLIGTLAWGPVPGNLCFGTVPGNPDLGTQPLFANIITLVWDLFLATLAWELWSWDFGLLRLASNLLYYGWRPQAYAVGEKENIFFRGRYGLTMPHQWQWENGQDNPLKQAESCHR